MEKISMDLDKGNESFDFSKCVIYQKSGSLVSSKDGRIKIIEAANMRNDEFHRRLMSSLDANFEYHMVNKCYKNYVHKKAFEWTKVNFLVDY